MTASGGGSARRVARKRLRALLPFVLLGAAIVVLALVTGGQDEGLPLDPRSSGPAGTKGLVDVLGELGAEVRIVDEVPDQDVSAALVLSDQYDEGQREAVLDWVAGGRTLVVADASSPLQPESVGLTEIGVVTPFLARECDLPALADVGSVTAPGGFVYEVPPGADGCFPRNEGSWLVARPEGEGVVVTLGGALQFINAELDEEDNALLAAVLLAPDGDGVVAVLEPPAPGEGDATLGELVPPAVRLALLQLLLAFGVVVLWRARRLGRPVIERNPVEIPGSQLVAAVGDLLHGSANGAHAAQLLRDDARRSTAQRLGLSPTATDDEVADAAALRTGASREQVLAVLAGGAGRPGADGADGGKVVDEAGLIALGRAAEDLRRTTLHQPGPVSEPAPSKPRGAPSAR